jgi:predicted amidohydrolase YtcJ
VELIVEDAEFVTMAAGDAGNGSAESMLVRDGRIAAIGPSAAVRAAAGPGAAVLRLDGATVVPGLIDAHCHVMNIGYLAAGADCSQPAAPDIAAIQARVVRRAGERLAALGITAASDADLRCQSFGAYAEADDDGGLSQRIYGMIVHDEVDELVESGQPYGSGILYFEPAELTAMVRGYAARGFQVCVHAQGDRAIEIVLDAYAQELAGTPGNPRRHRIEHGGAMYPALTARAAELGITVVSQPGFLSGLGDGFAEAFPGRADQLYAFRSWQRAGITVAGSSDAPVITPDPLTGIRDAIVRRTAAGQVIGPDERLTARDALAMYTRGSAYAMHRETELGSLEPGKLADFTVLDGNPLSIDPERITGIQVLATLVDGRPTYQAGTIVFPES